MTGAVHDASEHRAVEGTNRSDEHSVVGEIPRREAGDETGSGRIAEATIGGEIAASARPPKFSRARIHDCLIGTDDQRLAERTEVRFAALLLRLIDLCANERRTGVGVREVNHQWFGWNLQGIKHRLAHEILVRGILPPAPIDTRRYQRFSPLMCGDAENYRLNAGAQPLRAVAYHRTPFSEEDLRRWADVTHSNPHPTGRADGGWVPRTSLFG